MIPKELGKKTIRSAAWLSASSLLARILGAARLLILAAILPQSELGLFGMAIVVMRLVSQLSDTGMRQALIQREGEIKDFLGTAWTSQILRGILIGLLLFSLAEPIESFFEKEGLGELLCWLAILPVIQGAFNIGFVHLNRELKFNKVVIHQTAISLTDNILSILVAWFYPFAASLVLARLGALSMGALLSFIIEKRRARFDFSIGKFRELYRFGFWIFISSLLSFTMVSGGDLVTGKIFPIEALAIYQVAYSLACMPLMEIVRVLSTTMYPAFSRIQGDSERLKSAFLRVFSFVCIVSACSASGFFAIGTIFTDLFLSTDYDLVAHLLPVLSLWGASRSLGSVNSVLFQAIGKPALATVFQAVMVGVFFIAVIPLANYFGLLGLAWGLVLAGSISHIGRFIFLSRELGIGIGELVFRLLIPAFIGVVSSVGCMAVLELSASLSPTLQLLIGTGAFAIFFFFGTLASEIYAKFGVLQFLQQHFSFADRFVNSTTSLFRGLTPWQR